MNLDRAFLRKRKGVETPYIGECGRFDSCHGHNALLQKMPKNQKIMATITRYNSVQFSEVSNNQLAGVSLVYRSVRKDGTVTETCIHLGGDEFVPANGTETAIFKVWRNALKIHWDAKKSEAGLKVDNGGIAVKLRTSTPAEIVVRKADGKTVFRWDAESSIFARVGIMPTAKDLLELNRDYKKKMNKAAEASFKALKTKFEFDAAEPVATETAENAATSEAAA
jgi:hypothetical protein|nr:MAG TPA: hypothetical protein [Caudoviricetes sp.]